MGKIYKQNKPMRNSFLNSLFFRKRLFLPLNDHLLAVQVGALGPGVPGALRGEPQPRDRQASLVPVKKQMSMNTMKIP